MAVKISKPSKMKIKGAKVGCWSLEARVSCPGSVDDNGKIVEVCKSCYATKGMYRFPNTKAVRQHNKADYMRDGWVEDMVKEVNKYDYFRWFDSGDIETPELAQKIYRVIASTPHCKHWVPTRSDKVADIDKYLTRITTSDSEPSHYHHESIAYLKNVSLRPSADNIGLNNNERPGVKSFVIRPEEIFEAKKQGIHVCPVGINPNQKSCDTCTACYTNQAVAYVLH